MEAVGDVGSSYLLGFLDELNGLDQETIMDYKDLEYIRSLKKTEINGLDSGFDKEKLESSKLLDYEFAERESFKNKSDDNMLYCKKERSLDSSPSKRYPCTIGCRSLDDLELISRRGSLRFQFAAWI